MGLKMPSKKYDGESSEDGLKMPSKVDADFIRGLFVDPCSCCLRRSLLEDMVFCCSLALGKLWGIESRNFSCHRLY